MLKLFLTLFLVQICLGVQEYYVGGLKNNGDSPTTTLLITGSDGATSVTIRNISTTISSFSLDNHQSMELVLPYDISVLNSSYSQRNKGVKIQSSAAISVVVLSQNGNSSDAYQMHEETSHNQLGNYVYYALTPGASRSETVSSALYYSQILLLGRESETSVTIKPTQSINISTDLQSESDLALVESGSSYTGVLHEYQTLLIQSPLDLTLTQIISTKPLTVITGHECASFGSPTCSYIAEQIPPTIDWGTQFILSPLGTNDSQTHVILNSEENQDALITLSCTNGSIEQFTIPPGSLRYTSGPFGVFCTLDSSSALLVGLITNGSHPLMSLVPPILAFQTTELRFTSFSCTTKTYITLLLHNFNASNSNANIDPLVGITRNAIKVSSNNSAVSLTIDTELSNYTGLVVINSSGALVYNTNDDGNSCLFSYTPNWSRSISASILTFAKSSYTVSEGDESVLIGINRTLDLNTETQAVISVSGGTEGESL
ncbi:PREDICTED: uncharacterized protein LOC109581913 [Amphimedon queenslandica]|uniref:IgGFc-binding protein N-terminal domain-containing protein n=2 Tax=Amphimedon queenslandica TaxID=400682 RepID=A0AAN0J5D2_AMPQE|nr:PREDICTED: uncharacterized protein LOC109581913 [Amphimedon queenslandica]|eukprot:XP_019851951.1 PREDICTED: uncharacterized protein LOC109581913 [Amphimedon queenslandica]